jgi:hypothetical protein
MAKTSSHPASSEAVRPPENGRSSDVAGAVVLIVNVEVAGVAPGMTETGENEQLAPKGSPAVHESVTELLKLFIPVTTIW